MIGLIEKVDMDVVFEPSFSELMECLTEEARVGYTEICMVDNKEKKSVLKKELKTVKAEEDNIKYDIKVCDSKIKWVEEKITQLQREEAAKMEKQEAQQKDSFFSETYFSNNKVKTGAVMFGAVATAFIIYKYVF